MVSSEDIFGLLLGLFYAVFTPIAAYYLYRIPLSLKLRDVALGAFGYFATYGLHWAIARPALGALFDFLGRAHYARDPYVLVFFYNWFLQSAVAIQGELVCFLLLGFLASRKFGLGPGMAYAIGAGGAYCLAIRAHLAYLHLQWALASNENGPESLFGGSVNSPEFLARMFSEGIPYGVGAVPHFLIAIAVSLLVWKGVLEKRWAPVGAAILIEVVQAGLFIFIASLPSRDSPNTFDSLVSPNTYDSLLGLVIVVLLYWRAPISNGLGKIAGIGPARDGEAAGLLSVWRDQGWRDGGE